MIWWHWWNLKTNMIVWRKHALVVCFEQTAYEYVFQYCTSRFWNNGTGTTFADYHIQHRSENLKMWFLVLRNHWFLIFMISLLELNIFAMKEHGCVVACQNVYEREWLLWKLWNWPLARITVSEFHNQQKTVFHIP